MKIVHLNTHDSSGGAARAAYRLHTGLCRLGHDSSMFVDQRGSHDPTVYAFRPPMDLPSRVRRRLRAEQIRRSFARYRTSLPADYEIFSDDRTRYGPSLLSQLPSCDVINLHWIARFVDYRTFFAVVPRHASIVWTLHDMHAFTGGCHYDRGCGRYRDRCGTCPQLASSDEGDLSRQIWQRKREVFEQIGPGRLRIVAPSRWMATEVQQSALLGHCPVAVIPNGLDLEDFAPRDRRFARDVLGLPHDAGVILFVADSVTNQRKGFTLLAQALANMDELSNVVLISLGSSKPAIDTQIPHLHLSYITNNRLLSLVYSAADLFVIPSLQDNLPNTVLESLACGTPVVGFAVGGIAEVVRPGVTGLLVPPEDVDALGAAVVDLLQDPGGREQMAVMCRRIAEDQFSLEMQAQHYVELYEKIVALSF